MTVLRSVATAFFLVCFLVAPGATMGVVLCIGTDGHVSLEAVRNGRCSDAAGPTPFVSHSQVPRALTSADHCGPCVDVPLSTDTTQEHLSSALNTFPQLDASVLALVTCLVSTAPDLPTRPLGPGALPAFNPTLRTIRTVVLLL